MYAKYDCDETDSEGVPIALPILVTCSATLSNTDGCLSLMVLTVQLHEAHEATAQGRSGEARRKNAVPSCTTYMYK